MIDPQFSDLFCTQTDRINEKRVLETSPPFNQKNIRYFGRFLFN